MARPLTRLMGPRETLPGPPSGETLRQRLLAGIPVTERRFRIWGRHDVATPLSVAEEASVRCGWPLHVVENAADDPAMEQPEAFLETLRAALENPGSNPARTSIRD